MIWNGNGNIIMEEGEPAFRSCWECNGAHEHLKSRMSLHECFLCARFYLAGRFFDDLETDADFDAFMKDIGAELGKSTKDIK